jgi:hypothetical protein
MSVTSGHAPLAGFSRSHGPGHGLRAMTTSVSPGQSQKMPSAQRRPATLMGSGANSVARICPRVISGTDQPMSMYTVPSMTLVG